ncbi:hypothetical protein FOL47_011298, partial [Perkinsus chesapeaki]
MAARQLEGAGPEDFVVVDHPIDVMTKKKVLLHLRNDLQASGALTDQEDLRPECFGTHSFRRGADFGRWKSASSMQRYVEEANLANSQDFARQTIQQWNSYRSVGSQHGVSPINDMRSDQAPIGLIRTTTLRSEANVIRSTTVSKSWLNIDEREIGTEGGWLKGVTSGVGTSWL